MYTNEEATASCLNMVNILVYIIVWILFIDCIIELSKNRDNLFLLIFTIIIFSFLICCLSICIFLKYFDNMKCTIFNMQENDVHGDMQENDVHGDIPENDENVPHENSKLIQIIQIFINKIKKFIKWNNIEEIEEIQQVTDLELGLGNNRLPVAVLEDSENNRLPIADEVVYAKSTITT